MRVTRGFDPAAPLFDSGPELLLILSNSLATLSGGSGQAHRGTVTVQVHENTIPTPRPMSLSREDERLIGRVPRSRWAVNGIPEPERTADHDQAVQLVRETLSNLLLPDGIRTSPLGPGWSQDIDLYLSAWPEPGRLKGLGWLPLDPLLNRLGSPGAGRWAITQHGRVLGSVDLHVAPPPEPIAALIARCWRRREVRGREVLEARALLRSQHVLPNDLIIRVAARVEAGLGGRELAWWRDGPPLKAPAPLPGHQARRLWAGVRALGRPRLVVAVSGVDGSGKSTLTQRVAQNLNRVGVPVTRVWARPGLRVGWLRGIAYAGKRILGQEATPGVRRVAREAASTELVSRRGFLGWLWTTLVVFSFLVDALKQHARSRGVVLYDRHLVDALVTLDFVYRGIDLRLHRALIRRALPKPDLSVYLSVPVEVAAARKPEDTFGEHAISRQLESYVAYYAEVPDVHHLDGTRPVDESTATMLRWITGC